MRWLKAVVSIVSALACLVALVAWAWSYVPPHVHLVSRRGCLLIASLGQPDEYFDNYGGAKPVILVMTEIGGVYQHFLGFAHVSGTYMSPFQIIAIPYWFIVGVTAMLPIMWWREARRRRNFAKSGRCLGCGYDLRGSPERCPECGASAAASNGGQNGATAAVL
jgi:hypothetical protein